MVHNELNDNKTIGIKKFKNQTDLMLYLFIFYISACFKLKERQGIKQKVVDSMNMYSGANSSFSVLSEAESLPKELRIKYRECKLPRFAVGVNTMNYIILTATQVRIRKFYILFIL